MKVSKEFDMGYVSNINSFLCSSLLHVQQAFFFEIVYLPQQSYNKPFDAQNSEIRH